MAPRKRPETPSSATADVNFSNGQTQAVLDPDLILPPQLPFKKSRKDGGDKKSRHWKHLKQIIQAENYHLLPACEPTYVNIQAPPSMYPAKKYCDITGLKAPYSDPKTKLRYANARAFHYLRHLPEEKIQEYLAIRNATVALR
eukprot:jgi/Mesvir1/19012/Mv12780-RA.1